MSGPCAGTVKCAVLATRTIKVFPSTSWPTKLVPKDIPSLSTVGAMFAKFSATITSRAASSISTVVSSRICVTGDNDSTNSLPLTATETGVKDGDTDGTLLGGSLCVTVGSTDGRADGIFEGCVLGWSEGALDGRCDGESLYVTDGLLECMSVGEVDGRYDGLTDGTSVGDTDGNVLGTGVGG
mmetsp:Transcript_18402/g.37062  ORF Transcript_18402/g.37062 Transcript_18402/m.37062 type:complete len:183 (+) Transcript_18402:625-1173(+)